MIKFNKPENLNGKKLLEELNAAGVSITEPPLIDGNGDLWLDIDLLDEVKTQSIVIAHNGTIIAPEPTVADKLAAAGLTIEELKEALGL